MCLNRPHNLRQVFYEFALVITACRSPSVRHIGSASFPFRGAKSG